MAGSDFSLWAGRGVSPEPPGPMSAGEWAPSDCQQFVQMSREGILQNKKISVKTSEKNDARGLRPSGQTGM
nr:MAG TPA_asm: hypothetical protein [Caudoviricetes sp.]